MVRFFNETDGIGATNDYTFNSLVRVVVRLKGFAIFFINDFIASVVRTLFLNNTRVFLRRVRRAMCAPRVFCFWESSYTISIGIKNSSNKKDTLTVIKRTLYSAYIIQLINDDSATR